MNDEEHTASAGPLLGLTSEIVDHLRRNLDREYGIRVFGLNSQVFAARVPVPHIREFSTTDSDQIVGYMRTHIPRSELGGVAHAYVIADVDYVEVDPGKLFDDVYGAGMHGDAAPSGVKTDPEVAGAGAGTESAATEESGTDETGIKEPALEETEIELAGAETTITETTGADEAATEETDVADADSEKTATDDTVAAAEPAEDIEDVDDVGAVRDVAEVGEVDMSATRDYEEIDSANADSLFRSIESAIELEERTGDAWLKERMRRREFEEERIEQEVVEEVEEPANVGEIDDEGAEEVIHRVLNHFARGKHKKIVSGKQTSGRRAEVLTLGKRGRYVRYRTPSEKPNDIAIAPTVRAAAIHAKGDKEFVIRDSDLREKVRRRRVATLIGVVFDASGSMDNIRKTSVTRNVVLALLRDAYQRRDRVSLVTYAGRSAKVILPFTSSVELARRYIEHIPFGSTTPLASGLKLGMEVLISENKREPSAIPILVLVTDGTANMPLEVSGNIEREISNICRLLKQDIKVLVVDISEDGSALAEKIAHACEGRYYHPSRMSQQMLYQAIKREQENVVDVKSVGV